MPSFTPLSTRYVLLIQDGAHANNPALTGKKPAQQATKEALIFLMYKDPRQWQGCSRSARKLNYPKAPAAVAIAFYYYVLVLLTTLCAWGPAPVALLNNASIPAGLVSCRPCSLSFRSSKWIFHDMFSAKSVSYRSFLKEKSQNSEFLGFRLAPQSAV